jgi:flagella basal body P-ring formation protein FlgA
MRRRLLACALVLASAVPAWTAASDERAGRIRVAPAATVAGPTIRLGDLALLEGDGRAFAELALGEAPDPGATRRLEGVTILRKLREAGLDEQATRYEIPATVRVARAAQNVSAEELHAAVEREVSTLLAAGERLREIDVGGPVRIPPGPFEVRVGGPVAGSGGQRRFDAELVQQDQVVARVPVRAAVSAVGPVVTARRAVPRGSVLRMEDLTVEQRDLTGLAGEAVTELKQAVGMETRVALAAARPVSMQSLAAPLLVRRGDTVTILIETPGMRLSASGEALENGGAGAQVRVRNRASQQELAGQVVERGIVLVQY